MIAGAVILALSFSIVEWISRYRKMKAASKICWTLLLAGVLYTVLILWLVMRLKGAFPVYKAG